MTQVVEVPAEKAAPTPEMGRIVPLDAVRGVAVLMVMVHHFGMTANLPAGPVSQLLGSGWSGVDLFFVLSGFLITGILLKAKGSRHYFRNFYIRRVLRIFPLYYAVLGACLVVTVAVPSLRSLLKSEAWAWIYGTNWLILRRGFVFHYSVIDIGHFWSLAVEEHFYLVWPALVLLLSRRKLLWLCVLAFVAAPLMRLWLCHRGNPIGAYVFTPCRIDGLMAGSAIAILVRSARGRRLLDRLAWPVLVVAGLGIVIVFVSRGGFDYHDKLCAAIGVSLLPAFFGAVIWFALKIQPESRFGRVFCNRPLLALGAYSYGLYVLHVFVRDRLPVPSHPSWALGLVYMLVGMAISTAIAAASFHWYEQRFNRLKRFFAYGT